MKITEKLIFDALSEIGLHDINSTLKEYQSQPIDDFQNHTRFSWWAQIDNEILGDALYSPKGQWPSNNRIARSVIWAMLLRRRPEHKWIKQAILLYNRYPNAKSLHSALWLRRWDTFKSMLGFLLSRK